jgi:hypothetical protein
MTTKKGKMSHGKPAMPRSAERVIGDLRVRADWIVARTRKTISRARVIAAEMRAARARYEDSFRGG